MTKHGIVNRVRDLYKEASKDLISFREVFLSDESDVGSPKFHRDWSDILLNGTTHFAVEGFRESAKSQIVLRGHTLYRLTFPNKKYDYIMIIMSNQTNASKKLKEISREYLADPKLSIGLVKVIEDSANAFEIEVKYPFDVLDNKESEPLTIRIEAHGKGSGSIRGASHYSKRPRLVIIDDPQDSEDAESEATLEKDWRWFVSDVIFLGKKTRIFMIGNNLGARCLIERVIKEKNTFKFKTMIVPIMYQEGEGENKKWVSSWAENNPIEEILKERDEQTRIGLHDTWYQNKMCMAIAPHKKIFKQEMYKYVQQMPRGTISYYMTVDLAISKNLTADFTAMVMVGVNTEGHWFIPEIIFGRFDPTETIDQIFYLYTKYKPITVGIETTAFQAAIKHFLLEQMPKRNIFFSIKELKAEKKKELRISQLQPRFNAGTIWFVWDTQFSKPEWLNELELELDTFTPTGMKTGLHDDLLDGLAYMEQIAFAPSGWDEKLIDQLPDLGYM